jgi:oxygen-independent coproporphyrinogen-3 oxidase
MTQQTGIYISVPFCKAKCTYCNFASGVFAAERMGSYVDRVCGEIGAARDMAARLGVPLPPQADSIYLGGGTPSLLEPEQIRQLFRALRDNFDVTVDAEITLECAPGQLSESALNEMLWLGMNRISFGVQSFVDEEARAVGRLHTRQVCLDEIARMRSAGMDEINVDLIAGLPGQTAASWRQSVETAIDSGVPHISVYMLEVDEDSRLGREMLAAGNRYGAATTPTEDDTADWYSGACEWLDAAGVAQYEISNFARSGHASRHNIKYWRRQPYLGFGLDAHSMLRSADCAVRWANTDNLDEYLAGMSTLAESGGADLLNVLPHSVSGPAIERIGSAQAFEETMFLGLRMNEGLDLDPLRTQFGHDLIDQTSRALHEIRDAGLVTIEDDHIRLTARGRMASNEVFSRLLVPAIG